MAYIRGNPYIFDDGRRLHIIVDGVEVSLSNDTAEDLACMIWHRMDLDRQRDVLERVAEEHAGNFGADGVMQQLGRPTVMDAVRAAVPGTDA